MSTLPIVYPPPAWTNQDLHVYHGTIDVHAAGIVKGPVQSSRGQPYTDFGPGFYTTTLRWQAHSWAAEIAATRTGARPALIELVIAREDLATLDVLSFVRGDFYADDFWSLIHHCRTGASDHRRAAPHTPYYDVVIGPVASFWNQRMTIGGADQISFHTAASDKILNRSVRRRIL